LGDMMITRAYEEEYLDSYLVMINDRHEKTILIPQRKKKC
jgi:hypothetical protein